MSGHQQVGNHNSNFNLVILAAGMSSRMKDGLPKCLKHVGDETIIDRIIRQFIDHVENVTIVLGFQQDSIKNSIKNSDKISFVFNDRFKEDKNILSCNIALNNVERFGTLIVEGDVILHDNDCIRIVDEIKSRPNESFICSQAFGDSNKNRIGCVSHDGNLKILEKPDVAIKDNRMSGIFYFSIDDSINLKLSQEKLIESNLNYYYFYPIISNKNLFKLNNLVLSDMSQTVNTKEELECALKTLF